MGVERGTCAQGRGESPQQLAAKRVKQLGRGKPSLEPAIVCKNLDEHSGLH